MREIVEYDSGSSQDVTYYVPASDLTLSSYQEPVAGGGIVSGALGVMTVTPTLFGSAAPTTDQASSSSPSSSSPSSSSPSSSSPSSSSPSSSSPSSSSPQITLESAKKSRRFDMASQTTATVTQVSPLRVVADGATVDSLAGTLNGATYALDARVIVQVRNPQIPLVLGVES